MSLFFDEVYDFVRNADSCALPVDDCGYTVIIQYGGMHKEVIEGNAYKEYESLTGMIEKFVEKQFSSRLSMPKLSFPRSI